MPIDSVVRAIRLIEYLAQRGDWAALRSLARDLGISPATAHRLLSTLLDLGYVQQDPENSHYRLSLRVAWLGSRVLEQVELRHVARPWMVRLRELCNETVHLAVREGTEMVYLEKIDASQGVQMRSRVGSRASLHSTAMGKVSLAYLPPPEREALLAQLDFRKLTTHTITSPSALRRQLEEVRIQGYAIDDEENEVGIRCVAAAIFDHSGNAIGTLSVSGWTITVTRDRLGSLAQAVVDTCRKVSRELGNPGSLAPYTEHSEQPAGQAPTTGQTAGKGGTEERNAQKTGPARVSPTVSRHAITQEDEKCLKRGEPGQR